MAVLYSDTPAQISNEVTPGFPWSRYDNRKFIWEDALVAGNYYAVYSSAQGNGSSRERVLAFINSFKADKSHFYAFEVEIDGMILKNYFEFSSQILNKTSEGFDHHIMVLNYPIKNVCVRINTLLDGTCFMVRWLEIENTGDKPFAITNLFPLAGIVYPELYGCTFKAEHLRANYQLGNFLDNYWVGEGEFLWQDMPKGTLKFGFERGLFNPPMYVIRDNVYCKLTVIHIETTMMTQAEFTRGGDYMYEREVHNSDYVHFKVGIDKRAIYQVVQPGESVASPKIHISQIYGDMDTAVNEFNEHLRVSVIPKRNQIIRFPIEFNHTGYTKNSQIPKARMIEEVDMATEVGAELFVVDAGWFGSCKKIWHTVLGDWNEHELLENGLADVFDYARTKGMMCGMWMAAEDMAFSSELAKMHPDWFATAYGKRLPTINLLIPEVEEYVYNSIVTIIEKYKLDLFRIDGGLKEPMEITHNNYIEGASWKYFEKLHKIFDRLRERYPHLYFENCSGGGGRSDLGMMRRFDWMQVTDNFAPVAQLRTVYGMTLALAPEQVLSISGGFMLHQTDVDFLARASIFGRPQIAGIADSADRTNPEYVESWRRALALYRNELRPILDTCKIYHHTPLERYMERGKWTVLELSARDKTKSFTGIFRLEGEETGIYRFVPRGISITGNYKVYFDNTQDIIYLSGNQLMNEGVTIRLPGKLTSEIIVISKD